MRMPAGQQPLARVGFAGARHLVPVRLPSGGRDVPVNVRVIDLNADAMDNIMEVWNIRAVFQTVLVLTALIIIIIIKLYFQATAHR